MFFSPVIKGLQYVDMGDPTAFDYNRNTLTWDGAWHVLDLAAKVPAGTSIVHLKIIHDATTTEHRMRLRKYGNTNEINMSISCTEASGINHVTEVLIPCSIDRKIEYKGDSLPTTFNIVIAGCLI